MRALTKTDLGIATAQWVMVSLEVSVSSLSDSIEISIGHVLRAYQSGNLEKYDKFKLMAGDNLYNYSQLSIQNNPQLYLMYTK